jgi:hypothetical protein
MTSEQESLVPAGERHPDFEPGNTAHLRHGAYSVRKVGERAEIVRAELLDLVPSLDDPESASLVALYARATAREELAHEAIEAGSLTPHVLEIIRKQFPQMLQPGNVSPRLLEAASAAARVAKELGDSLGVGPRASAELRQIRAQTALTMSELARQAPMVLEAVRRTLAALGLDGRSDEFEQQLALQLEEVTGDDEED